MFSSKGMERAGKLGAAKAYVLPLKKRFTVTVRNFKGGKITHFCSRFLSLHSWLRMSHDRAIKHSRGSGDNSAYTTSDPRFDNWNTSRDPLATYLAWVNILWSGALRAIDHALFKDFARLWIFAFRSRKVVEAFPIHQNVRNWLIYIGAMNQHIR